MTIHENDYVDQAEQAIKKLSAKKDQKGRTVLPVTTSKIRNLLAMVSDIYNEVRNVQGEVLSEELIGKINYMKIRFYYEAGREAKVKDLLMTANVFQIIDEIGGKKKNFLLFSRYMEALVAFRKYYGGKDE